MLRKLMKHEFRATARVMGPLYLVLLVTALGANISTRVLMESRNHLLNMLGGLLVVAFTCAIIGVCIMSMVLMIQRFHKNLLGDEGYVMFTLPASVHQHVWSKLIVSAVWFIATGFAVCLAFVVMVFEVGFMGDFFRLIREIMQQLTAYYALNGTAIALELLVVMFLGLVIFSLQFYAAMAVGYSFANHKGLLSVAFFFASQFALQILGTVVIYAADATGFDFWLASLLNWNLDGMAAFHLSMLLAMVFEVLYGAVFYFVTTWFLKKRLNLE